MMKNYIYIIDYIIDSFTFKICGRSKFGPDEEKEATIGAVESLTTSLFNIFTRGFLQNWIQIYVLKKIEENFKRKGQLIHRNTNLVEFM